MSLENLETEINYTFKNKNLLQEALTHRSYLNENKNWKLPHNERLEFLGDAVLELITTQYLFERFKDQEEGELTAYRSALVSAPSLAQVAHKLKLDDFILLSKGEKGNNLKAKNEILGNALEALIGAIYLDGGYSNAKKFIIKNLIPYLKPIISKKLFKDSKSYFQEQAQAKELITPHYKLLKEWGPDHDKKFLVGVYLNDKKIAQAQGSSKQEAEIEAAKKALKIKGWNK